MVNSSRNSVYVSSIIVSIAVMLSGLLIARSISQQSQDHYIVNDGKIFRFSQATPGRVEQLNEDTGEWQIKRR